MAQIIEQQDIFGRIGEGFGKGLGDVAGKGAESAITAKGLNRVAQPGQNPLQMLSGLLRIPGMTIDKASMLLPYLRNASLASRGAQDQMAPSGSAVQPVASQGATESVQGPSVRISSDNVPFNTEKYFPTQEQKKAQALNLFQSDQVLYPTLQEAEQEIERRNAATQGRFEKAEQRFFDKVGKKLQATNEAATWGDVPGNIQQRILSAMQRGVLEGNMNPEEAANQASDHALRFARNLKKFNAISEAPSWGTPAPRVQRELANVRKVFDEFGALEEFKDLLISQGHGPHYASAAAFSTNESINKSISELKPLKEYPSKTAIRDHRRALENFISQFPSQIDNRSSLHDIAYGLYQKGYDPMAFYEGVGKLVEEGKLDLTDRQQRELTEQQPVRFTLPDILQSALSSPGGYSNVPVLTQIKRTFLGKR